MNQDKYRILHFIATSGYSGAERYLLGLLDVLKDSDMYECSVACPPGSLPKRIEPITSNVFELAIGSIGEFKTSRKLRRFLKKNRFHLLHVHGPRAHISGYFANMFMKKIPLAATVYELLPHREDMGFIKQRFYGCVEKHIVKKTPFLAPISDFVEKELLNINVPLDSMKRVYFGMKFKDMLNADVDTKQVEKEFTKRFLKEHNLPEQRRFVGMVGRLMPHKGHECFIKAVPGLISNLSDVSALVLGDGPLYDELVSLAKKLGIIRNINFIKQVENSLDFIKMLDLFVLPSHYESFGIAILEAISLCKPVIASNVGGIPEIIEDNKTGYLIKPDDYGALSSRAIQLLTNPILSQKFVNAAFDNAKSKFSEENFKIEILSFYAQIFKNVQLERDQQA